MRLIFFFHIFLFFSLPPAFSAEFKSVEISPSIASKSSGLQWTCNEAAQNDEINCEIEEEHLDDGSSENLYSSSSLLCQIANNLTICSSQNRFSRNPFQSYYSRLTNSPPLADLI